MDNMGVFLGTVVIGVGTLSTFISFAQIKKDETAFDNKYKKLKKDLDNEPVLNSENQLFDKLFDLMDFAQEPLDKELAYSLTKLAESKLIK